MTHLDLTPLTALALMAAGLVAGAVNAVAGGGSLLSLPVLIFLGLPPTVANASNRVAVLAQSTASALTYARAGAMPWADLGRVLPALLLGALGGAVLASRMDDDVLRPVLAVLLVVLGALVVLRPERWLAPRGEALPVALSQLLLLLVGMHGGFIQAGVGFTFLAVAVLGLKLDLVRANGLKIIAVGAFTAVSLAVFAAAGQVDWIAGGILAVGNATGGWLGARLAILKGAPWIRYVLMAAIAASAARLVW